MLAIAADDAKAREQNYKSNFRGVSWRKDSCKWAVEFEKQYLGLFRGEFEAAEAHDVKVRRNNHACIVACSA